MRKDKDDLLNGTEPLSVRISNLLLLVVDDAVTINEAALWLEELARPGHSVRHDSPLDELYEADCPVCHKRYKILSVFLGGAEIECGCGSQDVNFAEIGEEEMVRH